MTTTGNTILALAEGWIGTPYRHQASTQGVGCDCLGLVRGIWRALYGAEPESLPAYAPDWAERSGQERLLEAARRHFIALESFAHAEPGDLLVFRFHPHFAAKHLGILAPDAHFIHAYEQAAVIRSALVPAWRRRIAGCFRFPEV
ncbi:NlpC/P60 family putative phage cell wall peptidase [Agrobacterium vitis]|nr:NlpC/P60 family putative phage cell wall peptidase [Agrobacterium vitis]MBE1439190.1 NlpC/P60 family putative phage cell wall peptidase [Agrobacterium vitis]